MREALVLTFHAIGSTGLPGETLSSPADMRYALEPGSFEYVLSLLAPEKVVTAGELSGKESGRWVALTFDDGFVTDYSEAFPRLKSAGLRATFYVTAKKIGEKGYTDEGMLREMAAAGMEIGSHGMRHRYLSTLTGAEAREEIFRSRELISEKTGAEVLSFAAVGGHMARRELEYAWEAGYRTFATMKPGITRLNSRNMVLKRNHFQAGNSKKRLRGIALGESWALSLGLLRYEGLMLPKKMLGLRGYDCLKSVLLGRKARRTLP